MTEESANPGNNPTTADSPFPIVQILILNVASLAMQSKTPYLYFMVERLGVALDPKDIGFYLGLMSTVFLLAQCITSPIWGRLSDTFGRRKPFVLSGAFGTMMGFLWFGLSETYTMVLTIPLYAKLLAILGLALVGLSNNSTEIISTIVGELTDASNQSTAFASLPISWWLGGAIGPLVGAAMISPPNESGAFGRFPYLTVLVIPVTLRFLLPNLVVVTLLAIEFVVVLLFLKESHHGAVNIPRNLPTILAALRRRLWRWFTSNQSPTILEPEEGTVSAQVPLLGDPASHSQIVVLETTIIRVLSVNIILIIGTLAVNELCAAGYNKLLLLLLSSLKPTGLALTTNEIAYAFSATSVASILIQSLCFTTVERRFGFTQCYRASLLLSGFCCFYTPFIRLASGPVSLWVLLIGGVSLGFLANLLASTCSLLLYIRSSSPSENTLGSLYGLSAGVSSLTQAFAPFCAGFLWSVFLDTEHPRGWPMGPFIVWNVFGMISMIAFAVSLRIRTPTGVVIADGQLNTVSNTRNAHED